MTIAFIRTIILYLVVVIALRIMGKRQIGELSPSELVVTILISELAAIPMQDMGIPLINGIVPIFTLLSMEIVLSSLTLKSVRFRRILVGQCSMLIKNGVINQREMKRLRLTLSELLEELRLKNYPDIKQVRYAILETNGKLTVIPYAQHDTPTREDLGLPGGSAVLPLSVISDGKILWENLKKLERDRAWLDAILMREGYQTAKDVFLLQADENENILLIPKEGAK